MAPINREQLAQLRQFVDLCKENPAVLHMPELHFFKDYMESLGATIPKMPSEPEEEPKPEQQPEVQPEVQPEEITTEPEETPNPPSTEKSESEESDIELDNSGVIEPDSDEPLPTGDESKDVTDEMIEESNEKRSQAMSVASEGKFEEAINLYTEAIQLNPQSAALYAKRAGLFLKLQKPNAAIRDCNKALELNPDQPVAYKFRGRAQRLLGNWVEAAKDLSTACKLDYSEEANEWLKEVTPNAKKIQEHKRKYERKQEIKLLKEREEKMKKIQEEREKAAKEAQEQQQKAGDFGGFPGGMPFTPNIQQILQDPEIVQAFQDPEVAAAFGDITRNPANISKYQSNPKVQRIVNKIASKMGGSMPNFN
ncbi:hsc70-interacting protein-like [Centruroides vittatus]|uniref:hsc70-interacting protein-like n=1 Tax=Centruroides vittatus TaxID=120091 RepID=UPI00350F351F